MTGEIPHIPQIPHFPPSRKRGISIKTDQKNSKNSKKILLSQKRGISILHFFSPGGFLSEYPNAHGEQCFFSLLEFFLLRMVFSFEKISGGIFEISLDPSSAFQNILPQGFTLQVFQA